MNSLTTILQSIALNITPRGHPQDMLGTDRQVRTTLQATFSSPTHSHTSVSQPAKTYIHQLYADTGFLLQNLPKVMADKDKWLERVKGIRAVSMP